MLDAAAPHARNTDGYSPELSCKSQQYRLRRYLREDKVIGEIMMKGRRRADFEIN
jgi:hypothetical protein